MLTPMDIRDKTFNVKMRGYDQDQVNDFLDQIIADYESVLKEKETMAAELKTAKDQVAHYEDEGRNEPVHHRCAGSG
ncbi:DivIVA domain-containing protein [Lacticaseibacillus sharpeae]|uniref:DivIVA domain-containing protein n=1 Tax=Lacticaseibacillus sharpeae TaxID=1626 RepID=UPI0006D237DA|nr:DivIVA domain-containing protein [Lacticaseibacillus sharpeae]